MTFINLQRLFTRESKIFLVVGVLVAWGCFYIALSSGDLARIGFAPKAPMQDKGPGANANLVFSGWDDAADAKNPPESAAPKADPLERELDMFNFPDLGMTMLDKLVRQNFDLQVRYPASARSLRLEALECGGNSMGKILANLLAPNGYAFFRQGDTVQIVEATIASDRKAATESGEPAARTWKLTTTLTALHSDPLDLWIASDSAARLRIAMQPLFGETQERVVGLKIEGRQGEEVWFTHALDARVGQAASIEVSGARAMRLAIKPLDYDTKNIRMEVEFYYESPLASN